MAKETSNLSLIVERADITAKSPRREWDRAIGLIRQENPQGGTEGVTNKQTTRESCDFSRRWMSEALKGAQLLQNICSRWQLLGLQTVHLCGSVPRGCPGDTVIVEVSIYHDFFFLLVLAAGS